jgi:hypothetical protein
MAYSWVFYPKSNFLPLGLWWGLDSFWDGQVGLAGIFVNPGCVRWSVSHPQGRLG